jgi:hypothetical protein
MPSNINNPDSPEAFESAYPDLLAKAVGASAG